MVSHKTAIRLLCKDSVVQMFQVDTRGTSSTFQGSRGAWLCGHMYGWMYEQKKIFLYSVQSLMSTGQCPFTIHFNGSAYIKNLSSGNEGENDIKISVISEPQSTFYSRIAQWTRSNLRRRSKLKSIVWRPDITQ